MKIGILTFHYAHNYGAMLQAYALTTFLQIKGFDAEIIDYRLHYIYRNHERYNIIGYYRWLHEKDNAIISALKVIKSYRKHRNKDAKWHNFENFMNSSLHKSPRIYTEKELDKYDYIICGSDQIWNEKLTNGYNNIYWGNGINTNIPLISYAASNGSAMFEGAYINKIKEYLKRFKAISIREQSLCEWIKSNLGIPAITVIDPVFLLPPSKWKDIIPANNTKDSEYLLIYAFQEDLKIYEVAQNIAKQKGLKIIRVCYNKRNDIPSNIIQDNTCGPAEFISYIKNSSFICTTSFHGVAFSILFNKQFYAISPSKYSERVISILDKFKLSNRLIKDINDIKLNEEIDFSSINYIINKEIENSWKFLKTNLQ